MHVYMKKSTVYVQVDHLLTCLGFRELSGSADGA